MVGEVSLSAHIVLFDLELVTGVNLVLLLKPFIEYKYTIECIALIIIIIIIIITTTIICVLLLLLLVIIIISHKVN